MEFLFYRIRSESNVFWLAGSKEDPARTASNPGQGKWASLQWSGSNRNRCETFSGPALYHRVGTPAPCSTKLLPGYPRGPAIVSAGCDIGRIIESAVIVSCSRLYVESASRRAPIADPLLFLSHQASSWMRLRARQSIIELALLSRPGATSGATNR